MSQGPWDCRPGLVTRRAAATRRATGPHTSTEPLVAPPGVATRSVTATVRPGLGQASHRPAAAIHAQPLAGLDAMLDPRQPSDGRQAEFASDNGAVRERAARFHHQPAGVHEE